MAANPKIFDDEEEDGEFVEITDDFLEDFEETDDGGAIVTLDEDTPEPADQTDFYRNLAEEIEETELGAIAIELIRKIDYDKEARKDRDKDQELAIRRTGLGNDAPGGAEFEGASRVVHPMLTKATVEFESRAIGELLPPDGPVKDFIPGKATKARVEKARRKKDFMNWQFKIQMPEFRAELEQLLTQLPLGGSQYLRLVYDGRKKRPVPIFVPVDDVYLPYAASSFYSSERITYVEHITKFEYEARVESGQYRDIDSLETGPSTAMVPETTDSEKATEKIEGKSSSAYNIDGLRDVYEVSTYVEFESMDDDGYAPYLIAICAHSHKVLAVVRNWEEEDQNQEMMFWMAEFGFVPWRGVYSIGLGHMIGWISAAATGALRALLDSAHINNLPTLLKLKGTNFTGQSISLAATQITEIEGGVATDDIRKLIMPIPFNPPNSVLVELLGLLSKEGEDAAKTALDTLVENASAQMPVGTTMAVVEQGLKVMAAIHQRLHASMDMVIKILHRIDRMYVKTEDIKNDTGEIMAVRQDFQGPLDVVPVSDPQIFSDAQRYAQVQMVAQRAAGNPLYDQRKVEEMILERTKIPNAKDLLVPEPRAEEMNAVNENVAASLGRPIAAFPEQDHLAHLQVHLDFLQSPVFGMSPIIAPNFVPAILSHIREHIVLWYASETYNVLNDYLAQTGSEMEADEILKEKDPAVRSELDKLLATASAGLIKSGTAAFAKLPPIIQQAMQVAQQYQQPPPDPATQVAQIAAQTEREKIAAKAQETQAKEMGANQRQLAKDQAADSRESKREQSENERLGFKERQQNTRNQENNQVKERMNQQDNLTAMTIAAAEIEEGENSDLETGGGINPNPKP